MQRADMRSVERFAFEVPARVRRVPSQSEPETDIAEMDLLTRDISSGGAFIKSGQPVQVGTEITVNLVLPLDKFKALENADNVQINVSGRVIRAESGGFGVCFGDNYEIKPYSEDQPGR